MFYIPKKWVILLIGLAGTWNVFLAQDGRGLIYGKVFLNDGSKYQGQIRLENEEATWDALLNGYKDDPPLSGRLSKEEVRIVSNRREEFSFDFMSLWEDKSPDQKFSFRCHFGDIVRIRRLTNDKAALMLRDGSVIRLNTGLGGDLEGDDILVYDEGLRMVDLEWKEIASIEFMPAPEGFRSRIGYPIYGRLLTTGGEFEGYLTWDSEECMSEDLISGYQKGVKVDLKFGDIAELRVEDDGSSIELKSGRTIFLSNHDDVGRGNHGISIRSLPFGTVTIEWENLISAIFLEPSEAPPTMGYGQFPRPRLISGVVELKNGRRLSGQIIYDLDEFLNVEILNGSNEGFTYEIPFRYIKEVVPQNYQYSAVTLRNGERKLLGYSGDVTEKNHGLIVRTASGEAQYIAWNSVKRIVFDE